MCPRSVLRSQIFALGRALDTGYEPSSETRCHQREQVLIDFIYWYFKTAAIRFCSSARYGVTHFCRPLYFNDKLAMFGVVAPLQIPLLRLDQFEMSADLTTSPKPNTWFNLHFMSQKETHINWFANTYLSTRISDEWGVFGGLHSRYSCGVRHCISPTIGLSYFRDRLGIVLIGEELLMLFVSSRGQILTSGAVSVVVDTCYRFQRVTR